MVSEIEKETLAPKEEIEMMINAFKSCDIDDDGFLNPEELKLFVQKMGKNFYSN